WPAIALTTDTSALTAIGNDYGFEQVFARQVQALGKAGDVAVGISTGGRSANVLAAIDVAKERGLTTIGLSGGDGGPWASRVDIPIVVLSSATRRIQECHLTIGHILCEMVECLLLEKESVTEAPRSQTAEVVSAPRTKVVGWDTLLRLREQWRVAGKCV